MELSIKEKLLSGGLWVTGGKFFGLGSRLVLNALLARLLSPDDLGVYFLIFSLVNFAMLIASLGMDRSVVRTVSDALALDQPERANQAVRYVLQIGFVSSLLVAILLVSGSGQFLSVKLFGSQEMSDLIYYPAVWLILFTMQMIVVESFRGYHDIRFATIFSGITTHTIGSVALGLIFLNFRRIDLESAIIVVMSAYAANVTIALFLLLRKVGWRGNRTTEKSMTSRAEMLKTSRILYFTSFSLYFMEIGPFWLLAYFSSKESVAVYGAMMRLIVLITSTLAMIKLVILPMIRHLYATRDYVRLEKVLRTTATLAGIPSIIGLLLIIFFGKPIIAVVFGERYIAGYYTLVILSSAHLVNVLTGTPGALMVMASKEIYMLLFSLISCAVSIAIAFYLVHPLDYAGVAIGAGAGIILQNFLMAWFCIKKLSLNTFMDLREVSQLIKFLKSGTLKIANTTKNQL